MIFFASMSQMDIEISSLFFIFPDETVKGFMADKSLPCFPQPAVDLNRTEVLLKKLDNKGLERWGKTFSARTDAFTALWGLSLRHKRPIS
jgi:hypothetical protein